MTRATVTAVLILSLSHRVAAREDPAFLVKDLNTAQAGAPTELTSFAGRLYFAVSDTQAGPGLWRSDGTAAGTQLVQAGEVSNLTAAQGRLFLTIASASGLEVWTVDAAGIASRLTTAHTGFGLTSLTAVGSRAFFVIENLDDYSSELWRSDGTVAGTTPLTQFIGLPQAVPIALTAVGDTLFFASNSYGNGYELWKSDGSADGTVVVFAFDINGPEPTQLTDGDGTLYFVRREPDGNDALWRSDGSADGTVRIAVRPLIAQLTAVAGRLFFVGLDDAPAFTAGLWTSDGTANGAVRLGSPVPRPEILELTAANDKLFFFVEEPEGRALWRSDGTVDGTQRVRPVVGSQAASVGGTLYFNSGATLWKSDGTEAGTAPVTQSSLNPTSITDVEGTPFFVGTDDSGPEIWKSDGTDAGTVRVADLLHDTRSSFPSDLTDVQGTLLFTADSPGPDNQNIHALWRSDGSIAGTRAVADVRVNPNGGVGSAKTPLPGLGPVIDGVLYFAGGEGSSDFALWRSDGTEGGTARVADVTGPFNLTRVGHTLFFFGRDPAHGYELWKSDGSAAGTALVSDINPGPGDAAFRHFVVGSPAVHSDSADARLISFPPFELAAVGDNLFFGASDGASNGLWRTDGTAAGTVRLAELIPLLLTAVNGTLFFTTDTGGLWKSDGTAAGTVRVAAVDPIDLIDVGGVLYFFRASTIISAGASLWRSDGTAAGTEEVANVAGLALPPVVRSGSLFFLGFGNRQLGDETSRLYRHDASRAGVDVVKDLPTGGDGPGSLTAVYDLLFFGDHGQLWRSDGTEAGTIALQHLAVGGGFTLSGGHVFFAADRGDGLGDELWALPATARCDGDCGRDGAVSVADLVTAVNVALANAPLANCTAVDVDGSGQVTIDELVLAVGAALEGCTLTVADNEGGASSE